VAVSTEPKRRIIVKLWEHAVERTEAQIEELKAHGLFVRDATPGDKLAPHDEYERQTAAAAAVLEAATTPAPAAPPAQLAATPAPAAAAKPDK
jgi:hypothetical protein